GIDNFGGGVFDVTGAATLAGTLNISLINGFVPMTGVNYTIATFGSSTKSFKPINVPTAAGLIFTPALMSTGIRLDVTGAPVVPDLAIANVIYTATTYAAGDTFTV